MSYSHMLTGNTRSPYEMTTGFTPQQFPSHTMYQNQPQQSTSIALFHIPSDATNSLYIDGVPNDTS